MDLTHLAAAILLVSSHGETVLLDFRSDSCPPCVRMDPVVGQLADEGYPVRKLNVDEEQNQMLVSKLGIGPIPCFVMIADGRVVDRQEGACSRERLEEMLRKGGAGPTAKSVRGQSPETTQSALQPVAFPAAETNLSTVNGIPMPRVPRTNPEAGIEPRRGSERAADLQPLARTPARPYENLILASVRLRIEDGTGNSRGSGTIIDAREGEALILTCGHVFRDAAKDGKIAVDFFGPGAPQGVPGRLVAYDLKSDIGLLSVQTNYPVTVAHLAPAGLQLKRGDKVISVGCDGGADATARETQVTSINRYLEPKSNIQVAFQPVQGRSGGGLFTPEGWVVGVCNAADPQDDEGLFAGLPVVQEELDKAGLAFVYRDMPAGTHGVADGRLQAQGSGFGNQESGVRGQDAGVRSHDSPFSSAANGKLAPADSYAQRPSHTGGGLSADEQAMLEMLHARSQEAEVVCIIRPKGNPNAKSEIIVLDRVSPEFVRQLSGGREPRGQQRLTSLDSPTAPPPNSQPPARSAWPSERR